jgi:hypothetical protein
VFARVLEFSGGENGGGGGPAWAGAGPIIKKPTADRLHTSSGRRKRTKAAHFEAVPSDPSLAILTCWGSGSVAEIHLKKATTYLHTSGRRKQPTLKPSLATSEGPIDLLGVGS